RCLVPADLFYEWARIDTRAKQPYAIALRDNSLFAFAGLWERWHDRSTGQALETYSIITTDPNEVMLPIHDRMPVILKPSDYGRWLEPGDPHCPPVPDLHFAGKNRILLWFFRRQTYKVTEFITRVGV